MYKIILKRFIDLLVAIIGFVILIPLFLFVVVGLTIANSGTPFFFQSRPGLNGQIFKIIKFKTMTDTKNSVGDLLPDEDRITWIGGVVRKLSLDEIPQLLNVIKGDMSLVGPRPLLVEYLPLYNSEQARRHDVRPGISGWAQVNGRNTISWKKKIEYDVWYVDHLSFSLDGKILFLTIMKVFKRDGISSDTSVTMEKFKGE